MRITVGNSGADVVARANVDQAFHRLATSSDRLSTMQRIRRASDDPAQSIAAAELRSELAAIEKGMVAAERNRGLLHVADSGLAAASQLLDRIHGNVILGASDTVSPQEREALQLEIDAALEALDRLGNTSYVGRRVYDGETIELLAGSEPEQTASVDLPEVSSDALGSADGTLDDLRSGGAASLTNGCAELAAEIVDAARQDIMAARVEVGAFEKYAVDATEAVLASMAESITGAYSQIADTNVASEASEFARSLILAETSVMALKFTNATRESAAKLLDDLVQQRR